MIYSMQDSRQNELAEGEISVCGQCHAKIALRKPGSGAIATCWRCRSCGSVYLACPERREGAIFRGGVLPAPEVDLFARFTLTRPPAETMLSPAELLQIDQLSRHEPPAGIENRRRRRYKLSAPITVVALNDDFQVVGMPLAARTIDISCGGMSLSHAMPLESSFVAVDFSPSRSAHPSIVLHVTRCARTSDGYSISGEFLCRADG